ncbi:M30 family zinc metallopeptidase, partial [Parazoarcus communis]|uniref:M30 family zinc metallopeptidase n=1 Tax=Parazoarcus communis TaxID=41977 RepID=UPI0016957C0D
INTLITKFASGTQSVYTLATSLVGQPWGSYSSSASLIDPNQALDIVVLNIQPDGQAYGRVGYFWARNKFTTSSQPLSNQSLSLYVDSETIYLGGNDGLNTVISTLGHEFTHMANFYQRGVLHGSQYM